MNYENKKVFVVDNKDWDAVVAFCLHTKINIELIDTAAEASNLYNSLETREDWESSNEWESSVQDC